MTQGNSGLYGKKSHNTLGMFGMRAGQMPVISGIQEKEWPRLTEGSSHMKTVKLA